VSCKKHICTTAGQKQQFKAKLSSLKVTFDSLQAMSIH